MNSPTTTMHPNRLSRKGSEDSKIFQFAQFYVCRICMTQILRSIKIYNAVLTFGNTAPVLECRNFKIYF